MLIYKIEQLAYVEVRVISCFGQQDNSETSERSSDFYDARPRLRMRSWLPVENEIRGRGTLLMTVAGELQRY